MTSTGVTVTVEGDEAPVELVIGKVEALEREAEFFDSLLVDEGAIGLELSDEGAEMVVGGGAIVGTALDDAALAWNEAAVTVGGGVTVGVVDKVAIATLCDGATVTLQEGGATTDVANKGVTFTGSTDVVKSGAMLREGG